MRLVSDLELAAMKKPDLQLIFRFYSDASLSKVGDMREAMVAACNVMQKNQAADAEASAN